MPQSISRILVHAVFSTKNRYPFLRDTALREELHKYIGGILANLDCPPVIVGGVEDHVHFLASLSRTRQPAEMIKEVKRSSTLWINAKNECMQKFAWQNGYGIFSIGASQLDAVRLYIAEQKRHHEKVNFQDEFRKLLRRYDMEFDERYVWD